MKKLLLLIALFGAFLTGGAWAADVFPGAVHFETGKKDISAEGAKVIEAIAAEMKAKADVKVDVSGFTDQQGDTDANMVLAKERATAVRDALKAAGVAEDRIELKKPEQMTGSGDAAQARRVEVALQ